MKIIILAAGEGKRMWPIVTDKCLLPFLGKPLLYYNLKQVKENIKDAEFIIVANPQGKDEVEKVAKELNLVYAIAIQREPKGMADAVLSAKYSIDGEILVVNAEDQLDTKVYKTVVGMRDGVDVAVLGLKVEKYFPGGYLKVDRDRVAGIIEKPGEGKEPSNLVKLVVDYFRDGKKLVEYLEKSRSDQDDVYEVALGKMISDGVDVKFAEYDGIWIPLKYPWHVLDVMEDLLSKVEQQISSGAKVAKTAIVDGPVVIEDGARVFEGVVIKGPAYIGKNCIVGNNSMVRECNLEEGVVIGFNSDITRSYVGANSWFHTNYVGDCVIEGDLGMGSGAVLANLRLDNHTIRVTVGEKQVDSGRHKLGLMVGKGSRVGVNASIMPGVRIGSNSLVGPGVVLKEDVKDNTKIILKQEYQLSEHTPALTSYDQFREKLK